MHAARSHQQPRARSPGPTPHLLNVYTDPLALQLTLEEAVEACRMASGLNRVQQHTAALQLFMRVVEDCEVVLARVPPEEPLAHAAEEVATAALDGALDAARDVCVSAEALSAASEAQRAVRRFSSVLDVCFRAQRSSIILSAERLLSAEQLHLLALRGALEALPAVCAEADDAARACHWLAALKLLALVVDTCERVRGGIPANDPLHAEAEQLHARALEGSLSHALSAFQSFGLAAPPAALPLTLRLEPNGGTTVGSGNNDKQGVQADGCAPPSAEALCEILGACKRVLISHGIGSAALRESAQQLYRPAVMCYQALSA